MKQKELCCGCSACAALCPAQAIQMTADDEGYLYPQMDASRCWSCGLCREVCSFAAKARETANEAGGTNHFDLWPRAYAAWNRSEVLRLASSSGGLFRALADPFIQGGGVVYGAVFDESWSVCHTEAQSAADLAAMQGSKYVQSAMKDCFRQVKTRLQTRRKVLFTGTPCQIGGLYGYLAKCGFSKQAISAENLLYTAEIICHGVPSPRLFSDYLSRLSCRFASRPVSVRFRDKSKGWGAYYLKICFANGGVYAQKALRDWYYRLFLKNYFVRPSCYHCPYKRLPRQADVTLGDFWHDGALNPAWAAAKGVSLLLINNRRGEVLVSQATEEVLLQPTDLSTVLQQNLYKSSPEPRERQAFFRSYLQGKYLWLQWRYFILPRWFETPDRIWQRVKWGVKK